MPIYEFKCKNCQAIFETLVLSPSATHDIRCKKCDSPNVHKRISASSYRTTRGSSIPSGALSGCSSRSGFS